MTNRLVSISQNMLHNSGKTLMIKKRAYSYILRLKIENSFHLPRLSYIPHKMVTLISEVRAVLCTSRGTLAYFGRTPLRWPEFLPVISPQFEVLLQFSKLRMKHLIGSSLLSIKGKYYKRVMK